MRKFYSIVLMAAALLIGTNAWAGQTRTAANDAQLQAAWAAAQNGDVIQLTNDITLTKPLWLGTVKMNDDAKSITLNLGGKTLTADKGTVPFMFIITHGELNVENGNIIHSGTGKISSSYVMFHVCGSTYKNVDPKTATSGYFTHLNIANNVKLTAHSNAIAIDRMDSWINKTGNVLPIATYGVTTPASLPYNANVYRTDRGVANGVRVDVYGTIHANKYGIKANGNMGSPATSATAGQAAKYWADPEQTIQYVIAESDVNYAPFIYVHSSAEIKTLNQSSSEAIATYSGGYSRWLIEGYCEGSTGVYVKSGEVTLDDAVIKSNFSGDYVPAVNDRTSGVDAGGSGIVVESATAYAGNIDVTVQGDTKVTGTTGYAIDEAVTAVAGVTKVDGVTITGGTFETGENGQGAIKISEPTADANAEEGSRTEITIAGGQAEGSITLGDPDQHHELDEVVKPAEGETSVHVTYVDNGKGGTTMVISQGEAPQGYASIAAAQAANEKSVKLTASDAISGDVVLDELEINQADPVTLTISKSLTVGRVVLGSKAQIIVEAGAKFIVTGEQGIVAPVAENIVLNSTPTAQAIFLFHPGVTSNRHPNATVRMLAEGIGRDENNDYFWHRFTTPLYNNITSWEKEGSLSGTTYPTYIYRWDYENEDWANSTVADMKPMTGYSLTLASEYIDGAAADGKLNVKQNVTYIFKGELVGNVNEPVSFQSEGFNFFGNSYTANMSVKNFIAGIADSHIDGTVYLWCNDDDVDEYQSYVGISAYQINQGRGEAWQKEISPMQTFILKLRGADAASETVNYGNAVWGNPSYSSFTAAQAPRRKVESTVVENAYMQICVKAANGKGDKVDFAETNNNSDAFESGYDVAKYMNTNTVNLYSTIDGEDYSSVVTNQIEGKTLSLKTNSEFVYTLTFKNVEGNEYALLDKANNQVVAIEEGASYEFNAQPNSTVEGRFEIVGRQNMPTAIDNTEAVKSVKGVYTITGQYVGEDINVLPAGVYVVNGVKIVK